MAEQTEDKPTSEYGSEAEKAELTYDENSANLAKDFAKAGKPGLDFLKKLSDKCIKNFDTAWESTESYRERCASDWRLFTGDLPPKAPPFEHVPNPHVPIMLTNLSRIASRAQAELFGDWSNVFNVVPVGPDDKEIPKLLSLHGNWQIRQKITDFKRQMYRALLMFYVNGDVACHSYYDIFKRRNCHEILTTDDFVIPFVYTTTEPDYSDVPYKCKVMRRYRHELQRYRDDWLDVDKVIAKEAPSWSDEPESKMRSELADVQGQDIPDDVKNAPYKLIWYEGWCELPGDDYERYIKCVLDYATKAVLLLQVHEQEDWQDRIRYDRQAEELSSYQQALATYEQNVMQLESQRQQLAMTLASPGVDPVEAQMMSEAVAQIQPPPFPVAPDWLGEGQSEPKAVRKVPIEMFSHGVCIEPIVGSLGISFGRIEADLNRAANIAASQFADAADFNNAKAFITNGIEFEDGPPKIFPGAHLKVRSMTAPELDKAIKEFSVGSASPQLIQLVEMMVSYGSEVLQAPAVLSGESGKSGETYRGIAARIEQATKQLSVTTRKFADFLETILCNNGKLNAVYLDDEEVFYVNDHLLGVSQELTAGRRLYERDYRVEIRSDLRFTTQAQRISEADEALQLPQIVPPLQGNLAYWYHAAKAALEARDQHELVEQLGPPPPPPTTPMGVQPPPMMGPAGPGGPPPGEPGVGPEQMSEPQGVGPMAAQGGPSGPPVQPQAPAAPPGIQTVSDHGGAAPPNAPRA